MRDVAYVALGSNVGDRERHLEAARSALADLPHTRVVSVSRVEETPPFGPVAQGPFLNQMIALETTLTPRELLAHLQRIEQDAGRDRRVRWGPRTLDLDIVLYDSQTVAEADLVVPHPGLRDRDFWQRELAELRARHA